MLKIELETQECETVLQVLGQMPTSSGVYPLLMKIKEQAVAQLEGSGELVASDEDSDQPAD